MANQPFGMQIAVTERESGMSQRIRMPAGSPGGVGGQWRPRNRREIVDAHRDMARAVQEQVLRDMKARMKRKEVSTGRLLKVTADRRNIGWSEFGFWVGSARYLDNSTAKYWRTIEEGSAKVYRRGAGMAGLEMTGFWGGSIRGWGANRWGRVPHAGPAWAWGPSEGGQDKFRPYIFGWNYTVKREIAPMDAYGTAEERSKIRDHFRLSSGAYARSILGEALRGGRGAPRFRRAQAP